MVIDNQIRAVGKKNTSLAGYTRSIEMGLKGLLQSDNLKSKNVDAVLTIARGAEKLITDIQYSLRNIREAVEELEFRNEENAGIRAASSNDPLRQLQQLATQK